MGLGKVQFSHAHVVIIKVNLMKFIAKCWKWRKPRAFKGKNPTDVYFLGETALLRKSVSISLVAETIHIKSAQLVLVGYYHLIRMYTLKTNCLLINSNVTTK